jgi:hypothetical protein
VHGRRFVLARGRQARQTGKQFNSARDMENNESRKSFPWTVAIIAATVIIVAAFALVAYLRTEQHIKETVDKGFAAAGRVGDKAAEVARNFMTGHITETFRESITSIHSTQGDVLELAVLNGDETFTRTDEKRIGWGWVSLGMNVAEIRVPVTFRYHLRLSDSWRLAARDGVCFVQAPAIRASQPPAIHTDAMTRRAEGGWARFGKGEQLDELERNLTPNLEQRATNAAHIQLVREACRQSVAGFVKNWLMQNRQWGDRKFSAIVVVFPDEAAVASDQQLLQLQREPTVRLEGGASR